MIELHFEIEIGSSASLEAPEALFARAPSGDALSLYSVQRCMYVAMPLLLQSTDITSHALWRRVFRDSPALHIHRTRAR